MSVTITAIYCQPAGDPYIVLSYRVAQRRMRFQVAGHGQNAELERAVRIHRQLRRVRAVCAVAAGILRGRRRTVLAVHVAGAGLLIARAMHAMGLTQTSGRSTDVQRVVATWLIVLGLAVGNRALRVLYP